MQLEQGRQVMLQLHLSDQQIYCHLGGAWYHKFDGSLQITYLKSIKIPQVQHIDTIQTMAIQSYNKDNGI